MQVIILKRESLHVGLKFAKYTKHQLEGTKYLDSQFHTSTTEVCFFVHDHRRVQTNKRVIAGWAMKQVLMRVFFIPQVRSRTSARGRAASGDSPGATSWRGTTANTPAPSLLSATTVTGLSKHISPSLPLPYMFFFHFPTVIWSTSTCTAGYVFPLCFVHSLVS